MVYQLAFDGAAFGIVMLVTNPDATMPKKASQIIVPTMVQA